jgi:hypothetical protein
VGQQSITKGHGCFFLNVFACFSAPDPLPSPQAYFQPAGPAEPACDRVVVRPEPSGERPRMPCPSQVPADLSPPSESYRPDYIFAEERDATQTGSALSVMHTIGSLLFAAVLLAS